MSPSFPRALFISDLHLEPARPNMTDILLRFLSSKARTAPALFLLGDIFEAWVGDDDDEPMLDDVARALTGVGAAGTQVFFMHGNRDFLLGERFAGRAGFTLLPDPFECEIGGVQTILAHGDALCTEEVEYQRFRAMARTPEWQAQVLAQPLDARKTLARKMRNESIEGQRARYDAGMGYADVTEQGVRGLFATTTALRLIHGHTHRPATHTHVLPDGRIAERIVLSDWHEDRGEVLEVQAHGSYVRHTLT